jgi:cardiolipin synthase
MSTGAPEQHVSDRVLTVPNALSAARLLGVPVFLWAILTEHDGLALAVLFLSGLTWRDVIPWWLVGVLFARELFMAAVVLVAHRHGWVGLPVHLAGKAATLCLLYAFPLLLLGDGESTLAAVAQPVGWAFAWWGTVLYWVAGVLYALQLRRLLVDAERTVPA